MAREKPTLAALSELNAGQWHVCEEEYFKCLFLKGLMSFEMAGS